MTAGAAVLLTPEDAGYPALLAAIPSPPALYVRGRLEADDGLAVAIVGSRRASSYGLDVAEALAADLAARGVTIVSGLARGVDTAAHRGALAAGGRTVAVLGSGIDVVYPPENRALMAEIEERGAVVSQFPPGTPPLAFNFPARNRVVAGLALGVVVVEASARSGALITAGQAGDLGREVFAVPGRITSELSRGPHALIADGARLVRDWTDIVQELPDPWRRRLRVPAIDRGGRAADQASAGAGAPAAGIETGSEEARLLAMLSRDEPQDIESLIGRAGLGPARVAAALTALEMIGLVRQLEGQRWIAVSRRGLR